MSGYYSIHDEVKLFRSMVQCDAYFRYVYQKWMDKLAEHPDLEIRVMSNDPDYRYGPRHFYSFDGTFNYDPDENTIVGIYCRNTVYLVPEPDMPDFPETFPSDIVSLIQNKATLFVSTSFHSVFVSYTDFYPLHKGNDPRYMKVNLFK